jgi:hypothetical protein
MSANLYSIQNLLIGKAYRSRSIQGIIEDAEPRPSVWYENAEAYLVRVRPTNGLRDEYRTLAVRIND